MTTRVPLSTGSYVTVDPRASSKRLVGLFSEIGPQTSDLDTKQKSPPVYLRRGPGIVGLANNGTGNAVRGINTMAGITYVVIGPTLYSMVANGTLTQLGTGIAGGNGFLRLSNNTACLFILVPGSTIAYTYCPNSGGFAPYLNATFLFYGAIDLNFVDSYFTFLMANGRGFYNDDGQVVSGQGPPTFTTLAIFPREFGTDSFIGMGVDHREMTLLGALSSEGYVNAGNPVGSPFASDPASFMQIGLHPLAGYTVVNQDQTIFFIANDRTVRRKNGETPMRVSNSGIEAILENADLTGCYAMAPTVGAHPLVVFTLPAISRTLIYDCLTTEWFELQSLINSIGYWRPLCWYNAFGRQLVGDSQSGQVGYLSTLAFTEFGNSTYCLFTTQSIYDNHNRITHRRLELVITPGASTSLTTGALITLLVSDDSGQTWYARETVSLGALGQRTFRAFWTNLGQSRDRVYAFQLTDPTPTFAVDIVAELDGGKW